MNAYDRAGLAAAKDVCRVIRRGVPALLEEIAESRHRGVSLPQRSTEPVDGDLLEARARMERERAEGARTR